MGPTPLAAAAALTLLGGLAMPGAQAVTIPLCTGLTIVTAIDDPRGDYESVKRIGSVGPDALEISINGDRPLNGSVQRIAVTRRVLRADLASATFYWHHFDPRAPRTVPGSTALGTSAAVLAALKTKGTADIEIVDPVARAAAPAEMKQNLFRYPLRRVGTTTLPVTVNNVRADLPAIHARGSNLGDRAEFFFLDDERNPLTLRYRFGSGPGGDDSARLELVQISFKCTASPEGGAAAGPLERALLEQGRAVTYEIHFEFNSARIREASSGTIEEIALLLRKHPDWKLAIHGHTDSIASDAYNVDLSQRRAAAVKEALVTRHGVDGSRLTTAGFGERSPADTNETLGGRARNRRVELVRQ